MATKHFDLATDITLGGENSSDIEIASQKAVKTYVDNSIEDVRLTEGNNISIDNGVISTPDKTLVQFVDWTEEEP